MNDLIRPIAHNVIRRLYYPYRRGLAPVWMELLEPRRLLTITATPIDGGARLDSGNVDSASVVAVQADGKILIGGYDGSKRLESGSGSLFVMRLNSDHTIDTTFGDNGYADVGFKLDTTLNDLVVQADGSILGSGAFYDNSVNRFDYGVFKINAAGQIDTSFGDQGLARIDVSGKHDNDMGGMMSVDSQGRIIMLGTVNEMVDTGGDYLQNVFAPTLIRLTADGQLDQTFGDHGKIAIDMPDASIGGISAHAVYVQTDGSILITGDTQVWAVAGQEPLVTADHRGAFLTKLNADGSTDTSFGDSGFAYLGDAQNANGVPTYDTISGVGVQNDGKIVIAEDATAQFETNADGQPGQAVGGGYRLMRLNADGSIDASFTPYVLPQQEAQVSEQVTYIVSTNSLGGGSSNAVRINDDGTISALFGKGYTPAPTNPGTLSIGQFSSTGQLESSHDFTVNVGKERTEIDASQFTSADTMEIVGSVVDVPPPVVPIENTDASRTAYDDAIEAWDKNYDIFAVSVGGTGSADQTADGSDADANTPLELSHGLSSIFSSEPVQTDDVLAGPAKDSLTGDANDQVDLVLTA